MTDNVVSIIVFIIRAIQIIGVSYAALKLSLYGIAYMKKNMQKVEEAKDGIKNVGIGLVIVLGCEAIVTWLKGGIGF